jgi:hypothetical protein
VVAAGVFRSWRSCSTSLAVSEVVGCGGCAGRGGGAAAGVFAWSSDVEWGGRLRCG